MPEARIRASGAKCVLAALLVTSAIPSGVAAQVRQPNDNSISISIVSTSGAPLSFSTVAVVEAGIERFSNQRGEFFISGLSFGTYHLRIKQLGFVASDMVVQLSPTQKIVRVEARLAPIPFLLADVVVRAVGKCPQATDLTDPTNSALALIFGEVSKNADRLRLLRERYPFTYTLWREFLLYDRFLGPRNIVRDSVMYASTAIWEYSPGEVVQTDSVTAAGQQVMRLPQLIDLADTTFQGTHCFYYGGTEKRDEGLQHRIDFIPLSQFDFPDVEGSVYIDAKSYVLTSAVFRLTHGDKLKPPVGALEVTTVFKEIYPNVVIFSEITATQPVLEVRPSPLLGGPRYTELRQRQRLLNYRFLRGRPGDRITLVRADSVAKMKATTDSIAATFGTLSGTVQNPAKQAVSGAIVSAENPSVNVTTDAAGQFTVGGMLPGEQELAISAVGYEPVRIKVDVVAGKNIVLPLVLYPKIHKEPESELLFEFVFD